MIQDNDSVVNTFISIPREMSSLNCGAFVAGVVEAVLERSQFVSTFLFFLFAKKNKNKTQHLYYCFCFLFYFILFIL
jgi:hypothetical protein